MHAKKKGIVLSFGCIFLIAVLLRNPAFFASAVKKGISLCVLNVVPTLFPFLILSRTLSECGFYNLLPKSFCRLLAKFFHISERSVSTLLLGIFCGFPIGCRTACDDFNQSNIGQEEFTELMMLVTLPSPAFVIGTVGTLFHSMKIGLCLELSLVFSTLSAGLFPKNKKQTQPEETDSSFPVPAFSKIFCEAVASSTQAILNVCAYVVFFSALVASIESACLALSFPPNIRIFLQGITEMTTGIQAASASFTPEVGTLFSAFFLGFSGISVHSQLLSFCPENALSYKRFFAFKMGIGILTVLCFRLLSALLSVFP